MRFGIVFAAAMLAGFGRGVGAKGSEEYRKVGGLDWRVWWCVKMWVVKMGVDVQELP